MNQKDLEGLKALFGDNMVVLDGADTEDKLRAIGQALKQQLAQGEGTSAKDLTMGAVYDFAAFLSQRAFKGAIEDSIFLRALTDFFTHHELKPSNPAVMTWSHMVKRVDADEEKPAEAGSSTAEIAAALKGQGSA